MVLIGGQLTGRKSSALTAGRSPVQLPLANVGHLKTQRRKTRISCVDVNSIGFLLASIHPIALVKKKLSFDKSVPETISMMQVVCIHSCTMFGFACSNACTITTINTDTNYKHTTHHW